MLAIGPGVILTFETGSVYCLRMSVGHRRQEANLHVRLVVEGFVCRQCQGWCEQREYDCQCEHTHYRGSGEIPRGHCKKL